MEGRKRLSRLISSNLPAMFWKIQESGILRPIICPFMKRLLKYVQLCLRRKLSIRKKIPQIEIHFFLSNFFLIFHWVNTAYNMSVNLRVRVLLQCKQYRDSKSEEERKRLGEKATASLIFKGRKTMYANRWASKRTINHYLPNFQTSFQQMTPYSGEIATSLSKLRFSKKGKAILLLFVSLFMF